MVSREEILEIMDGMIVYQLTRVLNIARRLNPNLTEEDIRNPHDFPELVASHTFNYEDGILAGYISARIALLAEINRRTYSDLSPQDDQDNVES